MSKQDKKEKTNTKKQNKKSQKDQNNYPQYDQPSYLTDFESKWDDCFSVNWGQF